MPSSPSATPVPASPGRPAGPAARDPARHQWRRPLLHAFRHVPHVCVAGERAPDARHRSRPDPRCQDLGLTRCARHVRRLRHHHYVGQAAVIDRKASPRRRQRVLGEIEAVGHGIRSAVALVERRQLEDLLTEPHQADMRVLLMRDVPGFRVGAQHQAGNARTITERVAVELGVRVRGALRMCAIPRFDDWWINVIEPAAPIVPGDEDGRLIPQPTGDDRIDLIDGPIHAVGDVLHGVLAEIGPAVAIHPGDCRQPAR